MNRLFKDESRQKEFETNGFSRINLLRNDDISELMRFFQDTTGGNVSNSLYGVYVSLDEQDISRRREVIEKIQSILVPRLEEQVLDFQVHLGVFIVKMPGPQSFTFPHQDWIQVDYDLRQEAFSLTVWISLKDIAQDCGSLGVIPGSHNFFDFIPGSPSPAIRNPLQGHELTAFKYLAFPEMGAGNAIIMNSNCIHAAPANTSGEPRMAVGIVVTSKDAQLYHYFLKPGTTDKVLKLKVSQEFYINFSNNDLYQFHMKGEIPGLCEVVDEIDYRWDSVSAGEFEQMCLDAGAIDNGLRLNISRG